MRIVVMVRSSHRSPSSPDVMPWLGPCDSAALATALTLKRGSDTVTAVTVGTPADDLVLELALRAGATHAVRFNDDSFQNPDLRSLASLASGGLRRLGFDLVLTGHRSADWGSGALGPALGFFLGIPHISAVVGTERRGDALRVDHLGEDEIVSLSVTTPVLLAVADGPALSSPEVTEIPRIEVITMEDSTLTMVKPSDTIPPPPQNVVRNPILLSSSSDLLRALRAAGLLR